MTEATRVLAAGEFHHKRRFGPGAICRGAVLLECEWDGGLFESGMFLGGMFRRGEFLGGTFSGAVFRDGHWRGGTWLCGFDHQGRYRPRTDHPPHEDPGPLHADPGGATPEEDRAIRGGGRRRVVIASPHRHADLARLWHRSIARDLVPALAGVGLDVDVTIFCDAGTAGFDPSLFPGVHLESPRAGARDFIEFYDGALRYPCDYLFFIDADVFLLDGRWPASYVAAFDAPEVAAVSLLHRPELPGSIYALICRREDYRRLAPPVLPAYWDALDAWPSSIHRDPGALAALRLTASGKRIVMASASEMDAHLTDFHGTTNLRVCRESWAPLIGGPQFESLIARKAYFARGAYDNILLGWLYERVFGEPFAPGPDGEPLAGSVTVAALRRILGEVRDPTLQESIARSYARSERAIARLAAREGIALELPEVLPDGWRRPQPFQ